MGEKKEPKNINRRTFVKLASAAGMAGLAAPIMGCSESPTDSDNTSSYNSNINSVTVQAMVDEGIKNLTG